MPFEEQTVSIFAGTRRLPRFDPGQPGERVRAAMLSFMRDKHADVLALIRDTRDFGDEAKEKTVARSTRSASSSRRRKP
jgi:F-type H+-transporting ATPase subunit alpha